jgi:hypothetical protein
VPLFFRLRILKQWWVLNFTREGRMDVIVLTFVALKMVSSIVHDEILVTLSGNIRDKFIYSLRESFVLT